MIEFAHKSGSERHTRTAQAAIETDVTLIGQSVIYKSGTGYTNVDSPFRPTRIMVGWSVNDTGAWVLDTVGVTGLKLKKDGSVGVRSESIYCLVGVLNGTRELDADKVPAEFYEQVKRFVNDNWPKTLVDFHPSRRIARAVRVDELSDGGN